MYITYVAVVLVTKNLSMSPQIMQVSLRNIIFRSTETIYSLRYKI